MDMRSALLLGAGILSLLATNAHAQDPAPQAAADAPEGLEDIVVTAQKRSENIQRVPISITAVSATTLENYKIVTLQGLNGTVPNAQINNFSNTPNTAVVTIRGIGVVEPDPYAGNTVSIVYDGVPQFFSMGALVDFYDIERVEVLRGPQGTLFGANTTGGVVNIVTAQPTGEFGGKFEVGMGNYNRFTIAGAVDVPVTDTLAAKFVISHDERDGFFRNVVDDSRMDNRDVTIFRGYLKFSPTTDFDATLIGEYDRARNGGPTFQIAASAAETGPTFDPTDGDAVTNYPNETLYLPPDVKGYPNACPSRFQQCESTNDLVSANDSVPNISNLDSYRATLTMNLRNTAIGDLTSITGYRQFTVFEFTDQDQSPVFLDDTRRKTEGWQFSQEVRTSVDVTDKVNAIAGVFYLKNHYFHQQDFRIQFAAPGLMQVNTQDQDNYSVSAFVQTYWQATEKLKFQAGFRYTHEKTSMLAATITSISLTGETTFDATAPDGTPNLVLGTVAPPLGEESWDKIGWKFGADYQLDPDTLIYASWARGFKSGGFTGRIGIPEDLGPYDPEDVDTFELGVKADLFNRSLRVNLGGFYTDYRGLQIAQIYFVNDPVTGLPVQGNTILNAGAATIKGFELEVSAAPTDGVTLYGTLAYLDAEYSEFIYVSPFTISPDNPTGVPEDLKGNPLQNAPRWSATAGFSWTAPIGENELTIGARYSYVAEKFLSSINNSPRSLIQPTHLVDANVDLTLNERVQLGFWVRNLFDERYIQSVFDNVGYGGLVSYLSPRELGVSAKYRF